MKHQQYFAGVLLVAALVTATLLTAASWVSSMAAPALQTVETSALPSDGKFTIDLPMSGGVTLAYGAGGELTDTLTAPSAEEKSKLADLGKIDMALLLHKGSGANVTGYVDLAASLVFTGYHTIDINVTGAAPTLTVGPKVSGTYQNGVLNLLSERVSYTTDAGQSLQRQFRLAGVASQTPGILTGEYRETVWGYGGEPLTVVGTFEMHDLKVTAVRKDDNLAPTANSMTLTTTPNKAVAAKLTASDPEDQALTFTIVTQPLNGALSGAAPNLTYTPKKDFEGIDSFTFKVNDGAKDSATVAVTIDVNSTPPANSAPTANAQTVSVVTGLVRNVTLTGSDADGNTLTFVVVSQPSHGKLSGKAPALKYTSTAGFVGKDSFTFKVNDGKLDSPAATVSINVKATAAANTAPEAVAPPSVTTQQGQQIAITLAGTDADGDTVSFIIVTEPAHGVLSGAAPNLTYTPNPGFAGTDSFTYKVNDGLADSPIVTVTIVVQAGNDGRTVYLPMTINAGKGDVATTANDGISESTTPTVTVVVNDSDPAQEGIKIYLPMTTK